MDHERSLHLVSYEREAAEQFTRDYLAKAAAANERPVTTAQLFRLLSVARNEGSEAVSRLASDQERKATQRFAGFWGLVGEAASARHPGVNALKAAAEARSVSWEEELPKFLGLVVVDIQYQRRIREAD